MRAKYLLFTVLLFASTNSFAQQSPRIIENNRLDYQGSNYRADRRTAIPNKTIDEKNVGIDDSTNLKVEKKIKTIHLERLQLSGSTLPKNVVNAFWSKWRGKDINTDQLKQIANDLNQIYSKHDYALYSVVIPNQDFKGDVLRLKAIEGYIGNIEFKGETEGDMSLIKAYADKIMANRPLRRSVFQRYVLLMGDIPGLDVNSSFAPLDRQKGIVKLNVDLGKHPVRFGLAYNNQGAASVARNQFEARVALNSMLRQGDYTELSYGFPDDFERYQSFNIMHEQPLNSEGTRLSGFFSNLTTNPNDFQEGESYAAGLQVTHPILRSKNTSVYVNAAFDGLNNENAILGQTATDERTRVFRTGISLDHEDSQGNFTGGFMNLSKGFDAFGARQGILFGDPDFMKGNIRIDHDHHLPYDLVTRLRTTAQYTNERLPSSEQIVFGGVDFGGGFDTARFAADRGIIGSIEVAYPLKEYLKDTVFKDPEIYTFADYAYLNNMDEIFLPEHQNAASAGAGIRFNISDKVVLQLQAGKPVETPNNYSRSEDGWRYFLQIRTSF